jgi:ribosomal protein L35
MSTKSKRHLRGTTQLAAGDEKLVKRMFREKS